MSLAILLKITRAIVLCFLFKASLTAQPLNVETPLRFLALGDSYTIGESVSPAERWPAQLADSLVSRSIVIDTLNIIATTGWRTDNLINAISNKNLPGGHYNLVSLLIGVNNQYQGRPFLQYTLEFPSLVDSAIRYAGSDKSHVFIVSIPDYAYTPFGQQSGNAQQISTALDQYNQFAKHVADSMGVRFFDITSISRLGLQNTSYVAGDGLHPSGIQYTDWVKLILAGIDHPSTGIQKTNRNTGIKIFPNPTKDQVTVELPPRSFDQHAQVEVYNSAGKRIMQQQVKANMCSFTFSLMANGVYVIRVLSGGNEIVETIVKN